MGFRVSLGALEKMNYFRLFMPSRLVLMFPRQNFSDESGKPAHGVGQVACLACSLQIVKSFLLLCLVSNTVKRKGKRLVYTK
jgi:hypothetical protein